MAALPDLAVLADLTARGAPITAPAALMLRVASAVVRGAAQSPILETESEIVLWATDDEGPYLDLPGKPVTDVTSVTLDGALLDADDYKLAHGRLWRSTGWGCGPEPVQVEVELTHGFPVVPANIVQLVCDLAIAGVDVAADGAHDPRVKAEKIDDYSVSFTSEALASVFDLSPVQRRTLRAQYGGGAAMVSVR